MYTNIYLLENLNYLKGLTRRNCTGVIRNDTTITFKSKFIFIHLFKGIYEKNIENFKKESM